MMKEKTMEYTERETKQRARFLEAGGRSRLVPPKKLAVINDLSGYGRCSLTVSLPVISALGVQACPLPTSVLSNHTGFPSEYKYDFTKQMKPYMQAWEQLGLHFDGIITGYMNYDEQVKAASEFIDAFKTPDTVVFVDPAMADHGRLYRGFTEDYADYIKDRLIRKATIVRLNLTEACILTGADYETVRTAAGERTLRRLKSMVMNIVASLQELGPGQVVVTGIERGEHRIINVVAEGGDVRFQSVRKTGANRGGTGDIFSSIVAASVVQGMGLSRAVKKAAEFVGAAIAASDAAGVPVNEGVIFETIMDKLASTAFSASERTQKDAAAAAKAALKD